MAQIDIEDRCSCGAVFKAFGDSFAIALRHGAWLDAHKSCRDKNRPYTEEELRRKLNAHL